MMIMIIEMMIININLSKMIREVHSADLCPPQEPFLGSLSAGAARGGAGGGGGGVEVQLRPAVISPSCRSLWLSLFITVLYFLPPQFRSHFFIFVLFPLANIGSSFGAISCGAFFLFFLFFPCWGCCLSLIFHFIIIIKKYIFCEY